MRRSRIIKGPGGPAGDDPLDGEDRPGHREVAGGGGEKGKKIYPLDNYTTDELQEALRPIASLIRKSERAQQKLAPGTWQHTMLRDNLKALHVAYALMNTETDDTNSFTRDDLETALRAFSLMISKIDKAQAKFTSGTSQHTLQRNRLKALRIAEALINLELNEG